MVLLIRLNFHRISFVHLLNPTNLWRLAISDPHRRKAVVEFPLTITNPPHILPENVQSATKSYDTVISPPKPLHRSFWHLLVNFAALAARKRRWKSWEWIWEYQGRGKCVSLCFQFLFVVGHDSHYKRSPFSKEDLLLADLQLNIRGPLFCLKNKQANTNHQSTKKKTLTILNPLAQIDQHIMDESDLAGPIVFVLFGTFLLLSGKVHFGYIYSLALIGSLSLHTSFSLMSPPPLNHTSSHINHQMHQQQSSSLASSLTYPWSTSVLRYYLLPLLVLSLVGAVVPMDSVPGYFLSTATIGWCTCSSSGMFCAVGRMKSMRGLVAHPLGLIYVGFGIMCIFLSKRGLWDPNRIYGISRNHTD